MLSQQIVSGLAAGSLYALAALGLVLIYKATDVVNFAQGEMAMISTFICYTFLNMAGFSYWYAFLASLVFAALFGMAVQRVFMRPIQKAPVLNQIILTLGLYMVFRGVAGLIWGYNPIRFPVAVSGEPVKFGGVTLTPNQLFIMGITVLLMLLVFLLFRFTKTGLAMRAAAQNLVTSQLMGIRVGTIFALTWGLSIALAGVAGVLIAPTTYLSPNMMMEVLIKGFAAAVLGGFASLPGVVAGGLLLGVLENIVAGYISTELKNAFVFLLIILILYIRPTGLFGAKLVKKV